jgi:hypothetical protein
MEGSDGRRLSQVNLPATESCRGVLVTAVVLALSGLFGGACRHRIAELPWAPAGQRAERLDDRRNPGVVEVGFGISAVPDDLVVAVRQHYSRAGWRERTSPEAFKWHESRGGGVISVPGQRNPTSIGWCAEWVNRAGDIAFYSLRAVAEQPSDRSDVHVYASVRVRAEYFEQCGGR